MTVQYKTPTSPDVNFSSRVDIAGEHYQRSDIGGLLAHDDPAVESGIRPLLIGGYASATQPASISTSGDAVRAWFLPDGSLVNNLAASGVLLPGDASNGLDVDVTRVPTDPFGLNADAASSTGSISAKLRYLAATGLAGMTSLPAGTNNIGDIDVLTMPGTSGTVIHDDPDSGSPVKIGHKAIAHGTNPTAVAANDRTDWYANRHGIPWVMGGHPNINTIRLQFTAAQTNVAVITVSTGSKIVVTGLTFTLDNASTVFPSVLIGFGTSTTPTTSSVVAAHGGVPAGGGFSRGDGSGIIGVGADDQDLRITTVGAATGNGCELVVTYFTIES